MRMTRRGFLAIATASAAVPKGKAPPAPKALPKKVVLRGIPAGNEVKCVALEELEDGSSRVYAVHSPAKAGEGNYRLSVGKPGGLLSKADIHWSGKRPFDNGVSIHFSAGGRLAHFFMPGDNKERSATVMHSLLSPQPDAIQKWMALVRERGDYLEVNLETELEEPEHERVRNWLRLLAKAYATGFQEKPRGECSLSKLRTLGESEYELK